jgi:hypothetical protein
MKSRCCFIDLPYRDIGGEDRIERTLQLVKPMPPVGVEGNHLPLSVDACVGAPGC